MFHETCAPTSFTLYHYARTYYCMYEAFSRMRYSGLLWLARFFVCITCMRPRAGAVSPCRSSIFHYVSHDIGVAVLPISSFQFPLIPATHTTELSLFNSNFSSKTSNFQFSTAVACCTHHTRTRRQKTCSLLEGDMYCRSPASPPSLSDWAGRGRCSRRYLDRKRATQG